MEKIFGAICSGGLHESGVDVENVVVFGGVVDGDGGVDVGPDGTGDVGVGVVLQATEKKWKSVQTRLKVILI